MKQKLLLNKSNYKRSINKDSSLRVELMGSRKVLPIDPMEGTISEMEVYDNERRACTSIRLTLAVNVVATNILANYITEIVKDEGSEDVVFYNISGITKEDESKVIGSKWYAFEASEVSRTIDHSRGGEGILGNYAVTYNAVRDTQLSSENVGYKYHCGLDIFNNHTLRSKTFKAICPLPDRKMRIEFNTIEDYLRDADGKQVKFYNDRLNQTQNKPTLNAHVYLDEEIMSYPETVQKKLQEYNGWIGFENTSKFPMYSGNTMYDYFKTINDRMSCDFIDLSPERDLFSFVPKFNPYRRRIEKNWNYCLTYPSSSITSGISFIREGTNSLMVYNFDENSEGVGGTEAIKFTSVSMHGLNEGDYVNIYNGDEIIIDTAEVVKVYDEFSFAIFKNGMEISKKWVTLGDEETYSGYSLFDIMSNEAYDKATSSISSSVFDDIVSSGNVYEWRDSSRRFIVDEISGYDTDKRTVVDSFHSINRRNVNIDEDAQDISFKRVVNGTECQYYVRIFTKIPNWRFADKSHSEYELYKYGSTLIDEYNNKDNDFESHIGRLGFSKNIYNDDIAEVVFSDDINIDGLRDNLGRPLTDIYFTVVKNNAGYRRWYVKHPLHRLDTTADEIEYSHVFGKNTCAFRLSDESVNDKRHCNIIATNNCDIDRSGMTINGALENRETEYLDADEIEYNNVYDENGEQIYEGDKHFYGDLCCYCEPLFEEKSIQSVEFRFNTAQRELQKVNDGKGHVISDFENEEYFRNYVWDEILHDDFDGVGNDNFRLEPFVQEGEGTDEDEIENNAKDVNMRKEGYCYIPHFKIPIRTFSTDLESAYPIFYSFKKIYSGETEGVYEIHFLNRPNLSEGNKFELYDKDYHIRYNCSVLKVRNMKVVEASVEANSEDFNELKRREGEEVDEYRNKLHIDEKGRYKLFIRYDEEIPKYATFIKDGSCRYCWRILYQNGYDNFSDIEEYPFANNALYVEKNVNIYVRRQDPKNIGGLWANTFPYDFQSKGRTEAEIDNYYNELDIEC